MTGKRKGGITPMKKHLLIILAGLLALGGPPAYGETVDYGRELYEYDLIQGDQAGNLMADRVLSRQEMMVVLARLFGEEETAGSLTLRATFTDVAPDSYYAPYIAYAQGRGWTTGYPEGTFGPEESLEAVQAGAFLLRALGYASGEDFAYEDSLVFLQSLGLVLDGDFSDPSAVSRGEVFEMIYKALYLESKEAGLLGVSLGLFEAPRPVEDPVAVITPGDDEEEEEDLFVTVYGATTATTIEIIIDYQEAIAADSVSLDTYAVGGGDYTVTAVSVEGGTITLTVDNPEGDDLEGESLIQISPVRDLAGNLGEGLEATIKGEPPLED